MEFPDPSDLIPSSSGDPSWPTHSIGYVTCNCKRWPVALFTPIGLCGRCGVKPT